MGLTVNDRQVMQELGRLLVNITQPENMLTFIGDAEVSEVYKRIIDIKASPFGEAWEPWSEQRLAERSIKGNVSQGLLWDTGELMNSIRYEVSRDGVSIGTDIFYATDLQQGTDRMPAREFLGWRPESAELYEAVFLNFFRTGTTA